jgi:bifunctional UDP-N-acetylglucosamine pyrophosphorylase/glucosamine-1-phosphate N-acetyltransferase
LLRVVNEPLLGHALQRITECGLDDIVVVTSKDNKASVEGFTRDLAESRNLNFRIVVQDPPKGTGDAVSVAEDALGGESFLLVYADVFFDTSVLGRVVDKFRRDGSAGVMTVSKVPNVEQYGAVELSRGEVTGIAEKSEEGSGYANCGLYLLTSEIFSELRKLKTSPRGEYELTSAIESLVSRRTVSYVRVSRERWIDVGRPWDLLRANWMALQWQQQEELDSQGEVTAPVFLGEDVAVDDGSSVGPYSVLEDDVVVEENCRIERTLIMRGSRIGRDCRLVRSVVGSDSRVGPGTKTRVVPSEPVVVTLAGRSFEVGYGTMGAFVGSNVEVEAGSELQPWQILV